MFPQEPQFATLVLIFVSHPGEAVQSKNPALQTVEQTPFVQTGLSFGPLPHWFPQTPQFKGSVKMSVSHPFASFKSQLPKPFKHENPQIPPTQLGKAFVTAGQTVPQEPQLFTLVVTSVSQPGEESQSAKPELQFNPQETPLQVATEFNPSRQTFPQAPQFEVDEKSTQMLLQQPNPTEHWLPQEPQF